MTEDELSGKLGASNNAVRFTEALNECDGTSKSNLLTLLDKAHDVGLDVYTGQTFINAGRKDEGSEGHPIFWIDIQKRKKSFSIGWNKILAIEGQDSHTDNRLFSEKEKAVIWRNKLFGQKVFLSDTKNTRALMDKLDTVRTSFANKPYLPPSNRDCHWPTHYDAKAATVAVQGLPMDRSNERDQIDPASSKEPIGQPVNRIIYGPPGTGKTFKLQQEVLPEYVDKETGKLRYVFVTFHQSFGYEEFVEGLRPVLQKKRRDRDEAGKSECTTDVQAEQDGQVRYRIRKGAFLKLCKKARKEPNKKFAIIIDEINRGNISKILGELITLIEVDKRHGMKGKIEVRLPYSGKLFSVPSNVDFIGTMNTADRSLATLDIALRRRFEFEELMPKPEILDGVIVEGINIRSMLKKINDRIEVFADREHTIGHAYFRKLKELDVEKLKWEELQNVFMNNVIPLLQEYFFDDWSKIRMVLGDNQKPERSYQFVWEDEVKWDLLFGNKAERQNDPGKTYVLNKDALREPKSYIQIYAALGGNAQAPSSDQKSADK